MENVGLPIKLSSLLDSFDKPSGEIVFCLILNNTFIINTMSDFYKKLEPKHIEFIQKQKMFFVATADSESTINLSPKGLDTFRVVDGGTVAWLNLTGSGNETAAHVLADGRMTVMMCSFDKNPLILRLYGKAYFIIPQDPEWAEHLNKFGEWPGARQIFIMDIDRIQTSCGFAVPLYDFVGERETLNKWAIKKGEEGISDYWKEKNTKSIDGKPTGLF